jgi:hypothetical protein
MKLTGLSSTALLIAVASLSPVPSVAQPSVEPPPFIYATGLQGLEALDLVRMDQRFT